MGTRTALCALRRTVVIATTLAALRIFLLALVMAGIPFLAFAGGSDRGSSQTFGAYQVDFNTGPVAVKIRGESSSEVVTIDEQSIPSSIKVNYSEQGGILTVTVSGAATPTPGVTPAPAGMLYATMPRYEFVHIATGAGDVTIDNLSTEHLTIATQTGGIAVTNTNASLKASSTTGDQSYGQLYGALYATSTSGNVSVSHTWGIMDLKSQSGSLAGTDVALAGKSSFQTTSGAIKMNLAYSLYQDTFDLRSDGGKIRLGTLSGTGTLRWGRGNILVTGVTGSGSQDFQ